MSDAEKKLLNALSEHKGTIDKIDNLKAEIQRNKALLKELVAKQQADFDFNRVDEINRLDRAIITAEGFPNSTGYKDYEKARKIIDREAKEVVYQGVRNDNRLKDMREEIQVKIDEMKQLKADYIRLHDAVKSEYTSKVYNELGYKEVARVSEQSFMPIYSLMPEIEIFKQLNEIT